MKRVIIAVCGGLASFAVPATAGVLAPSKASQVVVLRQSGSGTVCLPKGGGLDVDLRMAADGTNQPFVQPSDQALVITGIDWGTTGGSSDPASRSHAGKCSARVHYGSSGRRRRGDSRIRTGSQRGCCAGPDGVRGRGRRHPEPARHPRLSDEEQIGSNAMSQARRTPRPRPWSFGLMRPGEWSEAMPAVARSWPEFVRVVEAAGADAHAATC